LGRVKRLEDGNDKYIEIIKKNFPNNFHLRGTKIVLDCGNGAGYIAAPKLLKNLGAKVILIGVKPNGFNINDRCGSTHPSKIQSAVKKYKAHAGISFDGDADRIIMCDENGKIIDGDQIIAMLARRWKLKRILRGGVIGTLMSNYGLEDFLRNEKIKFFRSSVGDRHVKEKMKKLNFNLGGEQSGHIILEKFATTGDGLMVAMEVLFSLRKGKRASELLNVFEPLPQILENVTVKDKNVISNTKCKKAIKKANKLMNGYGRLLVRKSGTEPKIRIMAESYNKNLILKCIKIIKSSIK
jgi:phosphoglucosamine mutase